MQQLAELGSFARARLAESNRCLRGAIHPQHLHDFNGCIEERALRFLARHCVNEWWFWHCVWQACLHAIGPRVQLAHVVEAIARLRRLNENDLLKGAPEELTAAEIARAVAVGSIVVEGDTLQSQRLIVNPLLHAGFDPVQAAVQFGGACAG
jgi:hypothetical protein